MKAELLKWIIDFVIDKTLATSSKFDIQKSQKSQTKIPIDQPTKSHTPQQEKIQTEILQRQRRASLKRTLNDILDDMPYLKSKLSKFNREKNGRPAVIEDQPDLLNAIVNNSSIGAAASDRRRSQELRSCKTLDDLNKSLLKLDYCLSRSATYLRLMPERALIYISTPLFLFLIMIENFILIKNRIKT